MAKIFSISKIVFIFLIISGLFSTLFCAVLTFNYATFPSTNSSQIEIPPAYATSGDGTSQQIVINGKMISGLSASPIMHAYMRFGNNPQGMFSAKIGISGLRNADALSGILLRKCANGDYCFLGLNNAGDLSYQESINSQIKKGALFRLPGKTELYIKMAAESGLLTFSIAFVDANNPVWIKIGSGFPISNTIDIGPALLPASTDAIGDKGFYSNFQSTMSGLIAPGLGKTQPYYFNFREAVNDLAYRKQNHVALMTNPIYEKLYNELKRLYDQGAEFTINTIYDPEIKTIQSAAANSELYLADLLYSYISGAPRKYLPANYKLNLHVNVIPNCFIPRTCPHCTPLEVCTTPNYNGGFALQREIEALKNIIFPCDAMANQIATPPSKPSGYDIGEWMDYLAYYANAAPSAIACGTILMDQWDATPSLVQLSQDVPKMDLITLTTCEYLLNIGLLCTYDPTFLSTYNNDIQKYISDVRQFADFLQPIYKNNNIIIKLFSSLAFVERSINAGISNQKVLESIIPGKYDANSGAFGEGTQYSQYTQEQLLPFAYYCKKYAIQSPFLSPNFDKNGSWLLSILDQSGEVPAVDDAGQGARPWLAPFFSLTGDYRFIDYTIKYYKILPEGLPLKAFDADGRGTYHTEIPKRFLTWPAIEVYAYTGTKQAVEFPHICFSGGVAKARSKDADNQIDVTLIGESGQTWQEGSTHDQQDNGSIAINYSQEGDIGSVERVVLDPGYGAFPTRHNKSGYEVHNVVTLNGSGINKNGNLDANGVKNMLAQMFGINATYVTAQLITKLGPDYSSGSPSLDNSCGGGQIMKAQQFLHGFEVQYNFDLPSPSCPASVERRGVILHDRDVFVFDLAKTLSASNFALHYNLPQGTTGSVVGNAYYLCGKAMTKSSFRAHLFSSVSGVAAILADRTYNPGKDGALTVSELTFAPTTPQAQVSFISTFEVRKISETLNITQAAYLPVTVSGASICVKNSSAGNGIVRYVFVNANPASGNVVTINGISTDADYGVLDFTGNPEQIVKGSLGPYNTFNGWDGYVSNLNLTTSNPVNTFCSANKLGVQGVTLAPFSNTIMNANQSITLSNGFWAQQGSSFSSSLGGCTQPLVKDVFGSPYTAKRAIETRQAITDTIIEPDIVQRIPFALNQNVPNPFNPITTIFYAIPGIKNEKRLDASIAIFNMAGQLVWSTLKKDQAPNYYSISWDASDNKGRQVHSGVYICHLKAGGYAKSIKMVLLR